MWFVLSSLLLLVSTQLMSAYGNQNGQSLKAADSKFIFIPPPQNWTNAARMCHNLDAHLAFPKTQQEADELIEIMSTNDVKYVHLGFHDSFVEGRFYTVLGHMINETAYNQWAPDYPISGNLINCGGMTTDGLANELCKEIFPAICERDEQFEQFKDYSIIEGHGYFKHLPIPVPWDEAYMACYNDGGHLAILNSVEEQEAILNTFNIQADVPIWMGAHHIYSDKYFVTLYDTPLGDISTLVWASDQPEGTNAEKPVVYATKNGLYTESRSAKWQTVCEHPLMQNPGFKPDPEEP